MGETFEVGLDLHQAADIARNHHLSFGGDDCSGLALAELQCDLGLFDRIRSGRAATYFRIRQFTELHITDRLKKRPWRASHPLSMRKMTRVVVRNG